MNISNPNVVKDPHNTGFFYELYYNYYDREPYYRSMAILPHQYRYKPQIYGKNDERRNVVEGFGFNLNSQYLIMIIIILLILFFYN